MNEYILCSGENCPLKNDCKRFKRDLNRVKDYHFDWPPIKEGKCFYFDKKDEGDYLFDKIKNMFDANKDKNGS